MHIPIPVRPMMLALIMFLSPLLKADWAKSVVPFEVTAITKNESTLWICGANAAIASSSDGGAQWDVHSSKQGAGTLFSITWANEKLGVAGGTGGLLLMSTDGGSTWQRLSSSISEPILALSFADALHGIVLTPSAMSYTADGAKSWQTLNLPATAELAAFKFILAVAALDTVHAAALVKRGPAQYYDGRIFSTVDAGKTWKTSEIEHTTLNNLLIVAGEYWLVGTEVIDRDNHGGHAVAVTFHSHDGLVWDRGPKPLIDTNTACRPEGCLMWNGALFDPFVQTGKIHTFPKAPGLTTQWGATDTRICALIPDLQCADTVVAAALPPDHSPPAPQLAASELRPTPPDPAGKCIRCDYPRILISHKVSGKLTVQLAVSVREDGTVSSVEVMKTPDEAAGENAAAAARGWLFYPMFRDGVAVGVKRSVSLDLMAIKPK